MDLTISSRCTIGFDLGTTRTHTRAGGTSSRLAVSLLIEEKVKGAAASDIASGFRRIAQSGPSYAAFQRFQSYCVLPGTSAVLSPTLTVADARAAVVSDSVPLSAPLGAASNSRPARDTSRSSRGTGLSPELSKIQLPGSRSSGDNASTPYLYYSATSS